MFAPIGVRRSNGIVCRRGNKKASLPGRADQQHGRDDEGHRGANDRPADRGRRTKRAHAFRLDSLDILDRDGHANAGESAFMPMRLSPRTTMLRNSTESPSFKKSRACSATAARRCPGIRHAPLLPRRARWCACDHGDGDHPARWRYLDVGTRIGEDCSAVSGTGPLSKVGAIKTCNWRLIV